MPEFIRCPACGSRSMYADNGECHDCGHMAEADEFDADFQNAPLADDDDDDDDDE